MAGWVPFAKPTTTVAGLDEKTQKVQGAFLQRQFARNEVRHLGRKAGDFKMETLKVLQQTVLKNANWETLVTAFNRITQRLQSADLTINFSASGFFLNPNESNYYTQMYERAVRTVNAPGQAPDREMRLKDTSSNSAKTRADVDDRVTFRSGLKEEDGSFKPAYRRMGQAMATGKLAAPTMDARPGEVVSQNPNFNPYSKQVFAALNYGRRFHGGCTYYGNSYFVLNPRFKRNALYFAGDTFGVTVSLKVGAEDQVSYDYLGAIYAKANPILQKDLLASCYRDKILPDTDQAMCLLEAHLFEPLYFPGNLEAICISARDKVGENRDPVTGADWYRIQTNVREFAARHSAKVFFIE